MNDHGPVPYGGPRGIRALLDGMHELLGWEPIMEGENIIGLADVTGGGAISLEPGGQFELSGAPVDNVHQTASELFAHLAQVREVARPLDIGFLGLGMTPRWTRADIPKMPKGRYKIMTAYMPKVGTLGLDMMYRTCTVQTNHDFSSEADMVLKMRVALALQPVATALFANSPFTEGKPNGFLSFRSEIWRDTDNARAGMLPWVFEDGMGFERYADYALDVPMYFIKRGDSYIDVVGQVVPRPSRRQAACRASVATISDWANHVSTIFPEVRLKRYIEMRGSDGGPWRRLPSLPAFWVGLIYDDANLDACWEIVKDWTRRGAAEAARRRAADSASRPRSATARCSTSQARRCSLRKRAWSAASGSTATAATRRATCVRFRKASPRGITPAEELLDDFNGPWNGSVDPIFFELAY